MTSEVGWFAKAGIAAGLLVGFALLGFGFYELATAIWGPEPGLAAFFGGWIGLSLGAAALLAIVAGWQLVQGLRLGS